MSVNPKSSNSPHKATAANSAKSGRRSVKRNSQASKLHRDHADTSSVHLTSHADAVTVKTSWLKLRHFHWPKWYFVTAAASVILIALWLSGLLGMVIEVPPLIGIGAKHNTLSCDYAGSHLAAEVTTYANVDNFYRFNRRKINVVKNGDYSKYVYDNSLDKTVSQLVENIKQVASDNSFNNDQTLELATCFVQNIPYNEERGTQVVTDGNSSMSEQFPYETLYKNTGICTDKTYLGSLILQKLGYGTAIFVFPDKEHMSLAIKTPNGYTDFGSKYSMMELTSVGFAPGQVPSGIDDGNGRASLTIKKIDKVNAADNPNKIAVSKPTYISDPTLVIEVNDGKEYDRIIPVKNLERRILSEYDGLLGLKSTLVSAYYELQRRDSAQQSAYSYYLSLPSTTQDCGYKYNYSYSYSYDYYSPYSYSSPYEYRCDTVTNFSKSLAYSSYLGSLGSYNNQVRYYNTLVNKFNAGLGDIDNDYLAYKSYDYNSSLN